MAIVLPNLDELRSFGNRVSINLKEELINRAAELTWGTYLVPLGAKSTDPATRKVWCELINLYLMQNSAVSTVSGGSIKKRDFGTDPTERQLEINKYSIALQLHDLDSQAQLKVRDILRIYLKTQIGI